MKTAATFHLLREQLEKRGHFDLFFCLKTIITFFKEIFFVVATFPISFPNFSQKLQLNTIILKD
jgi:hypothetical protein